MTCIEMKFCSIQTTTLFCIVALTKTIPCVTIVWVYFTGSPWVEMKKKGKSIHHFWWLLRTCVRFLSIQVKTDGFHSSCRNYPSWFFFCSCLFLWSFFLFVSLSLTCLLDNTHFGRLFQMRNEPKLKESVIDGRKTRNGNEINRKFSQI